MVEDILQERINAALDVDELHRLTDTSDRQAIAAKVSRLIKDNVPEVALLGVSFEQDGDTGKTTFKLDVASRVVEFLYDGSVTFDGTQTYSGIRIL